MRPRVVVVGSANMDLIVRAERIPAPGETVVGGTFSTAPGGKGANQAVAAARLGAEVWFVGRVGRDAFGDALAVGMAAAGIHTDYLVRDDSEPTGVALIGVDSGGENAIMVASGANHRVGAADVEAARAEIEAADVLLVQLEVPMEAVKAAIEAGASAGAMVILNPAPTRPGSSLSDRLLGRVSVLTPNEHEAAHLLGLPSPAGQDWERAARELRDRGAGAVVITLGEAGCILADSAGVHRLPAVPVQAIDTTAAGDCFTGALAVALAEGRPLMEAAQFASRAAALSVARLGAQPSLPSRAEVEAVPL
jgi:ribokinase